MFKPRPKQAEVLRYRYGKMGVSAVPGSGKTQTLSYLAARLIAEEYVQDDQEALVVTLVNSAVDNFSTRIESFIREFGVMPGMGYRVRTLHGLAHDIVRERPDLAGLPNQFMIVDEREADDILENAAGAWLRSNPDFMQEYTNPEMDPFKDYRIQREWQTMIPTIAGNFIRQAKDMQLYPADIRKMLNGLKIQEPLLEMGCEIYENYQRGLNYRGSVDFDDLIRLALQALKTDPDFLARLRRRWPYILEDEAQDSSRLQEEILRLLCGDEGNWVRVGDPNQAIYETFTTASPRFLLDFMEEPGVIQQDLPNSGRSTQSIIDLANYLIRWTREEHPNENLREALSWPEVKPTGPGDPQPNPPDCPAEVHLVATKYQPEQELHAIVRSLQNWLPGHPDSTVAVLVPRNERGGKLVQELEANHIPVVELLRSSLTTRKTASLLAGVLKCLADPSNTQKLTALHALLRLDDTPNGPEKDAIRAANNLLRTCKRLEGYLYPYPGQDWLADLAGDGTPEVVLNELVGLREYIRRWQLATLLPVDQLVLTVSQDVFTDPVELALAHKLALFLERTAREHPEWNLEEFTLELDNVANNRRKFMGFGDEDMGFDPDQHKGKVVVATIHKAKGLEWDRVYLMSVSNYDFPSGEPYDSFIGEKWFVRDRLNLPAEALARLQALAENDLPGIYMEEGPATLAARAEYAAERLRLLYVGITRARKELIITWNTGRRNENVPALPFVALQTYWEQQEHDPEA